MRFIVTCSGTSKPSNKEIKYVLSKLGLENISVVFVNSEGISSSVSHRGQALDSK